MIGDASARSMVIVGLVALVGAAAAGCGDSPSADSAEQADRVASSAPKATTTKALSFYDRQVQAGTVRLAAVPIGVTGGALEVKPAGLVDQTDHYYKPGTVVTLHVRDGGNAKFAAWGGACTGRKRTCKVTMTDKLRVLAGFAPKTPQS